MLWKRKLYRCTAALAGVCYSLKFFNCIVKGQSTVPENAEELQNEESSFIYIPETSEYYFDEDGASHKLPLPHLETPQYWQLLMMSKSKKRCDRHKAVKLLSELDHLEKWEYSMISQACGPSIAIGLARSSRIHRQFFIPPPLRIREMSDLCQESLNLINLLPDTHDPSIQDLSDKAKKIGCRILNKKDISDEPEKFLDIYHSERKKKDILVFNKLCLCIFLHHSTIKSHKVILIKNGILKLLWDILQHNIQEIAFQSLVAQMLANLAVEAEIKNLVHCTGWIGILANWSRSPYIQLNLPSIKALANLDDDDFDYSLYDDDIFLLHPVIRTSENSLNADVIFIHGIKGATFWTWRQSDCMKKLTDDYNADDSEILDISSLRSHFLHSYTYCWPKDWLPVDFPHFRFLSVDYDSDINKNKSFKSEQIENENLCSKATVLLSKLLKANVGERPIVWVTHSMGGILLKQMLIEASKSQDSRAKSIVKNTTGVIFFSVPHKGSELASFLQSVPYFFQPSVDVSHLHKDSPMLLWLHSNFMKIVHKNNIAVLSFTETKKSKWLLSWQLVSQESANPGVGEFYTLPVDHLSTCKPENRDSYVYLKIKEFLQYHVPIRSNVSKTLLESELDNYVFLMP